MAPNLSFDNLSIEHLGSWQSIKLRMTEQEIVFKTEKTGKSVHVEAGTIEGAEWLYRARGWGLCVKVRGGQRHYFDGWAEAEMERAEKFMAEAYNVAVVRTETCLKGWNWGKPRFEEQYMEFIIDGMRGFDINLKDVINVNLSKNELTLQFQTLDDAFSIFEMRFATVSTNENLMNDMYQNVIRQANILEANGDALVSLKEMHCLQPRGRYEIKLYEQFIHLRGKTYDYSLPKNNIVRFFLLPHPDDRQIFFVIQVDPPITHGQTRYHFIILLFNNEDEINIDINCNEQWLKDTYNGNLDTRLSGLTYEVVTKLFKVLYDQKLTVPNKFETKEKSRGLTCSYKTSTGFLYPLDKGFIFVPKPALSIRSNEIVSVNISRTMQRTFDLDIETTSTTHTFTSIDKKEYNLLLEFIKFKKYVLSSGGNNERREDWSSSGESHDGYLERMKTEGKRNRTKETHIVNADDDEDDEEDEDFNPDQDAESSLAEEYDSEVSISSSNDDDDGNEKSAKTKEGLKTDKSIKPKLEKNVDNKHEKRRERESEERVNDKKRDHHGNKIKSDGRKSDEERHKKKQKPENKLDNITDGKRKKPKKIRDPNEPKKPMTAYFLFASDYREEAKKQSNKFGDIAKLTGERWKLLPDEEKAKYASKYMVCLAKYEEEMKLYKASGKASVPSQSTNKAAATKKHVTHNKKTVASKTIMGESSGKLSAGLYKSEEFVASSDSSSL